MRVDLIELLKTREIAHPSRVMSLETTGNSSLLIEVSGYPWWLDNPEPASIGKITFYIEGITDGLISSDLCQADSDDEALEWFDVRPLSDHDWARGVHCNVYCSSPILDSLKVHANLSDYLKSISCPYGPEQYLNMGHAPSFSEFLEITSSNSYLFCHGPEMICQKLCEALKQREVAFNLVRGRDASKGLVWFQLGETFLICKSAYAVYPD